MGSTFLVALIVAALALIYWRVTLLILGAVVIATLVTGVAMISDAATGRADQSVLDVLNPPEPPVVESGTTPDVPDEPPQPR